MNVKFFITSLLIMIIICVCTAELSDANDDVAYAPSIDDIVYAPTSSDYQYKLTVTPSYYEVPDHGGYVYSEDNRMSSADYPFEKSRGNVTVSSPTVVSVVGGAYASSTDIRIGFNSNWGLYDYIDSIWSVSNDGEQVEFVDISMNTKRMTTPMAM